MYTSVFPAFPETGMGVKGIFPSVFQNEPSLRFQEISLQYSVGQQIDSFHIVGGVGKNHIVAEAFFPQEKENVPPVYKAGLQVQFADGFSDKPDLGITLFHHLHQGCSAGSEFKTYAAGS